MTTESYLGRKDIFQTLRIEELVKDNAGLTIKLQLDDTEVGRLKLEMVRMEDNHLALTVKLEDANNEIGRLGMVLKRQGRDRESINQFGK